jgi:hypothetical protein
MCREPGSQTVKRIVSAALLVVGEQDSPRAGELAEPHAIIGRRMTERCLGSNLMGQQRRVMNQQVDPGGQVQCRLVILTPAIRSRPKDGRAVVRNVGERGMAVTRPGVTVPNVQSPRSPPGGMGKCGGDMALASTASALVPGLFSGISRTTLASSRSPPPKNGSP